MSPAPAQLSPRHFDQLYGLELLELVDQRARAKVRIRDELRLPAGGVHGGVLAATAESLAELATGRAIEPEGSVAELLSLQLTVLRPVSEGSIEAVAVPRHRGRTTWVWEIEFYDDSRQLCALSRATIAVNGRSQAA